MSTLYENELRRLIEDRKSKITLLSDKKHKELELLRKDIEILEHDLKHYEKAMERFRVKPVQPSTAKTQQSQESDKV